MKEWFTKERITAWGQILLGCLLGAMAYPWFLVPNHIAPGGVTGLATVLNYLFGWPVGTASLLMNIPLFLIGYRSMGRTFAVRSLGATVIFSLLIDFLPLQPMTHDPLLGPFSAAYCWAWVWASFSRAVRPLAARTWPPG